uniref:Uncharacterized protein n=1 Tax=Vitrella brassicaformis TaxID=1169539 RepID=A0A7S1JSA5_9ALVE|mmetsp:Transcript_22430/g.55257  ORF Transcript_22430/g.55257 Transcript_22430/m.55257 type:complete len:156 (+) Transcript_22430:315-782(+)
METIEHLFIGLEQCTLAPSLNNTKAVTAAEWPQRCDDSQLPAVVSEPSRGSAALPRDGDIVWRAQRASGVRYRWWYMTPDWPPEDFDYDGVLRKLKLRRVEVDEWENAEDCEEGYTKVYEIKHYRVSPRLSLSPFVLICGRPIKSHRKLTIVTLM